jgi:O-methyltransferase
MKPLLRRIHGQLPEPLQEVTRKLWGATLRLPFLPEGRRTRWIKDHYTGFGQGERRRIFLSIARFMHINRPIPGYYFEFGCNEANTMRMAWDTFKHLFDLTYVGFDSFEGLPEIDKIDEQQIWEKGKLAYPEDRFIRTVTGHGMPTNRLVTVKGFYDDVLNENLKNRLLPHKAAVVYIDCDLYKSTVPVLEWVSNFLQNGTIIVFDDWNCFHGDPERGERRAWREFRERHPALRFEPFVATAEAQSFICIGGI